MLYIQTMKEKQIPWKTFKKSLLSDPETKKAYINLEPRYRVIEKIIEKRIMENLTQKELAEKTGLKQSAISRLESGTYNPSLDFLNRIARGMGYELKIELQNKRNY